MNIRKERLLNRPIEFLSITNEGSTIFYTNLDEFLRNILKRCVKIIEWLEVLIIDTVCNNSSMR